MWASTVPVLAGRARRTNRQDEVDGYLRREWAAEVAWMLRHVRDGEGRESKPRAKHRRQAGATQAKGREVPG